MHIIASNIFADFLALCGLIAFASRQWLIPESIRTVKRWRKRRDWIRSDYSRFATLPDYPPDWERRRSLVFVRDKGLCRHCQRPCGQLRCAARAIWDHQFSQRLLTGAHIHHATPLSRGGTHRLPNLELVCESCHIALHPDNPELVTIQEERAARLQETLRREKALYWWRRRRGYPT